MTFDRLDLALKESVGNLHGDHRRVLHWYAHHVGEEHDYHDLQLQDGIPLIFPYKHICRLSKKGEYAVSVSEVDPISWTGLRVSQARVRVLLAMIPVLVPLNFSLPWIPLPEHRWPRGTSRPGSGSPGLDGASGHCRTESRLPLPAVPRWHWRRLSGTPPRTSASATTAPQKCCRCTGPSRPC